MQSQKQLPSWLSPQWLCGCSCTWEHKVWLPIAGTNKPKGAQQAKQGMGGHIVFKITYILHPSCLCEI